MRTGHRELIRDLNRTLVLNLVREHDGLSRAAIARLSGLSPSTVTMITASLIEDGYLLEAAEGGPPTTTIGRPATTLRVDPTAGYVVGIKVAPESLTATVTDLAATPLGTSTVVRGHESGAEEVSELVAAVVDMALAAARVGRDRVVGVGMGVPGLVDPQSGRVADSPLLGWSHLDLVELLERRLGVPVLLENDVNTLTIAEQLFGAARALPHVLVVTVGRGIGMGVVVNGLVHRGAHGGAGEIGHVQVAPAGPDCWCGRRGCLEAVAAEPAVVREILAVTGRLIPPTDIAASAARDADVAGILERAGHQVGRAVGAAAVVLDPHRVVISGEGLRLGPVYIDAIEEAFTAQYQQEEETPEFVIEPWGDEAWARGAASLVLRELFHPAHLRDEATSTPSTTDRVARTTPTAAQRGRGDRR